MYLLYLMHIHTLLGLLSKEQMLKKLYNSLRDEIAPLMNGDTLVSTYLPCILCMSTILISVR